MKTLMGKHLIEKRIKITKKGKILRRPSKIGHNLAKKPSKSKRQKQKLVLEKMHKKLIIKHLG